MVGNDIEFSGHWQTLTLIAANGFHSVDIITIDLKQKDLFECKMVVRSIVY